MTIQQKSASLGATEQDPRQDAENETGPDDLRPADDQDARDHDAAGEDPNRTDRNSLADIARKKMHRR